MNEEAKEARKRREETEVDDATEYVELDTLQLRARCHNLLYLNASALPRLSVSISKRHTE
jgi:hypothetical protein